MMEYMFVKDINNDTRKRPSVVMHIRRHEFRLSASTPESFSSRFGHGFYTRTDLKRDE